MTHFHSHFHKFILRSSPGVAGWGRSLLARRAAPGRGGGGSRTRGLPAGAAGCAGARARLCLRARRALPGRGRGRPHTRRRGSRARCARELRVPAGRGREAGRGGASGGAGESPAPWPARRGRLLSRGRGGARRGPGGGAGQHERRLPPRCARRRHPSATLMLHVPALQI